MLTKLNRLLLCWGEQPALATALLLLLDPASGQGSLASAGHPAPIMLSDRAAQLIEPSYGLPLGVQECSYQARTLALAPGDALLLYTDGLTEARRDGELFGERRLLEAVAGARSRRPELLVRNLRDTVTAYAGELRDDLLILALCRSAKARHHRDARPNEPA